MWHIDVPMTEVSIDVEESSEAGSSPACLHKLSAKIREINYEGSPP
jgi:hypothetical protein